MIMNKKFCIRCLFKVSLSLCALSLPQDYVLAESSPDQDTHFLFSIEDENKPYEFDLSRTTDEPVEILPFPEMIAQAAPDQVQSPLMPNTSIIPNIENPTEVPPQESETIANDNENNKSAKTILINFNNVNIIEYIRFISRISNKNFTFDENDLQFNVTIISEEPATIDNIMTALLQELRIHDLALIEQGNNIIIHRNPNVNSISKIVSDNPSSEAIGKLKAEIITQVFRLNTVSAEKAAIIIRPLSSASAIIEVLEGTNHLIITDLSSNIIQIGKLLKSIDSPQSGLVVGQYLVRQGVPDALINLTEQIMRPIALDQPLIMVSHVSSNSIFIVAPPYLVDRSLSIMQYLDQTQGTTQILNLGDTNYQNPSPDAGLWEIDENGNWRFRTQSQSNTPPKGAWNLDSNGNWKFTPIPSGEEPPFMSEKAIENWVKNALGDWVNSKTGESWIKDGKGQWVNSSTGEKWMQDANGNWIKGTKDDNWIKDSRGNWVKDPRNQGGPRVPDGQWLKDVNGNWIFQLAPGKPIAPEKLARKEQTATNLPIGHIERTKFFIYRLHYRQASLIEQSLRKIGESLKQTNTNADLVGAIDTIQSIEATNSLIFTGTTSALDKLKELIEEIDRPLRQVFLELLILETTLTDSMAFGVDWGSRWGGGNSAGGQAFLGAGSPLLGALDTTVGALIPSGNGLARNPGFNLGVLGKHLTHGGAYFNSIGALVSALHKDDSQNIILNPKILTEDNSPAEIFVGINTQFPTQAIANDNGNILTQNFEYLDVGVRFKVTPLIGESDLITLDIEEERTDIIPNPNPNQGQTQNQNIVTGPSTSKSKTTTRVHMPNGYFLILSGQIADKITYSRDQIPCLGGIPVIGAAFSHQTRAVQKTNLLLFIRPLIIDTYEEMHNITKHQQDIWKNKNSLKTSWKYETQQALEFFNLRDSLWPDYDTGGCECD